MLPNLPHARRIIRPTVAQERQGRRVLVENTVKIQAEPRRHALLAGSARHDEPDNALEFRRTVEEGRRQRPGVLAEWTVANNDANAARRERRWPSGKKMRPFYPWRARIEVKRLTRTPTASNSRTKAPAPAECST